MGVTEAHPSGNTRRTKRSPTPGPDEGDPVSCTEPGEAGIVRGFLRRKSVALGCSTCACSRTHRSALPELHASFDQAPTDPQRAPRHRDPPPPRGAVRAGA